MLHIRHTLLTEAQWKQTVTDKISLQKNSNKGTRVISKKKKTRSGKMLCFSRVFCQTDYYWYRNERNGRMERSEGQTQTAMQGADVCEGVHEVADWVFNVRVGLGFQLQHCQHVHFFCRALRYSAAHNTSVKMRFTLRTEAGAAPSAKTTLTLQHMEPANMTPTFGGKYHAGTVLPSEMNVLTPDHLILLIRPLTSASFGFPSTHKRILSHMSTLDQSLIRLQCFTFDCVWPIHLCAHLTERQLKN